MQRYRTHLVILWFGFGGLIMMQTVWWAVSGNPFGDNMDKVWSWLLPNILPTFSLILGSLVLDPDSTGKPTRGLSLLYGLALGLSAAYLLSLLLVLYVPFLSGSDIWQVMKGSNMWLAPFQGLVASVLGVFFAGGGKLRGAASPTG